MNMNKVNKILKILIVLSVFLVCLSTVASADNEAINTQNVDCRILADNTFKCNINCENDFNGVNTAINSSLFRYDFVVLNITHDMNIVNNTVLKTNSKPVVYFIAGNNHVISFSDPKLRGEAHFMTVEENNNVFIKDLTLSGFNTAIINKGNTELENVNFINNRVKYIFQSGDDAGAIKNYGLLNCTNCRFNDNAGLYAGAIYGIHGAITHLNNCSFTNNTHFKDYGNDLYSYNNATFYVNDVMLNENDTNIRIEHVSHTLHKIYENIDAISLTTSGVISSALGFILTKCGIAPIIGAPIATGVGFVIGLGINLGFRFYYSCCVKEAKLTWKTVGLRVLYHGLVSGAGATVGCIAGKLLTKETLEQILARARESLANARDSLEDYIGTIDEQMVSTEILQNAQNHI